MNTSTSSSTSEHLLLFRNDEWDKGLSAEELQSAMTSFMNWIERLRLEGKYKAGQPLERTGKVVTKKGISDGPYAESKEAVGGYFLLDVRDFNEALAIAQQCPIVKYGCIVEVRPVAGECPHMKKANAMAGAAA